MAAYKITSFQLAWSFNTKIGGFVRIQTKEAGWSNPIKLATDEEAAAVGIILNGEAGAWFDTDLGGVVAAEQPTNVFEHLSKAMPTLEGGDGPFPRQKQ